MRNIDGSRRERGFRLELDQNFAHSLSIETTTTTTAAPIYTLVDLSTNVSVTNDLDVYLNLSNLFDEDYQDVAGYETLGFGLSAGFRYKLK